MPGSLNSVAYMGGMGGMPQPMSRLSLPSAKVRPDGVETLALILTLLTLLTLTLTLALTLTQTQI